MNHDDLVEVGEDFLAHYGIKGQKHGIRRWQNEDGSLTPEGYIHYGINPNTGYGNETVKGKNIARYKADERAKAYNNLPKSMSFEERFKEAEKISDKAASGIYGLGRYSRYKNTSFSRSKNFTEKEDQFSRNDWYDFYGIPNEYNKFYNPDGSVSAYGKQHGITKTVQDYKNDVNKYFEDYDKLLDDIRDFYKDYDEEKYTTIAAIADAHNRYDNPTTRDLLSNIYGYKVEDLDQNYTGTTAYVIDKELEDKFEKFKTDLNKYDFPSHPEDVEDKIVSIEWDESSGWTKDEINNAKNILSKFPDLSKIDPAEFKPGDEEYWDIPWSKLEPWQIAEINKQLKSAPHMKDYIKHSGIKGQKWGIRRYQNEDGSLTPEGRKRYGLKNQYSGMSDDELRKAINEKRTQNQYINLMTDASGKQKRREDLKGLVKAAFKVGNKSVEVLDKSVGSAIRKSATEGIDKANAEMKEITDKNSQAYIDASKAKDDYTNAKVGSSMAAKSFKTATSGDVSDIVSKVVSKRVGKDRASQEQMAKAVRNVQEMSPEELKKTVDRMLLEKQYDEMLNPPKPSKVEKGKEALEWIGNGLGIAASVLTIAFMAKQLKIKHEDDEFLAHYGVKGQQRGVRRYQNEDGSLTPEGYRHYGIDPNSGEATGKLTAGKMQRYAKDNYKINYKSAREQGLSRWDAYNKAYDKSRENTIKTYGESNYAIAKDRANKTVDNAKTIGRVTTVLAGVSGTIATGSVLKGAISAATTFLGNKLAITISQASVNRKSDIESYSNNYALASAGIGAIVGSLSSDDPRVIAASAAGSYVLHKLLSNIGYNRKIEHDDVSETDSEYLAHYGVLGMKWGVRKYENRGGSYTQRGYEHWKDTEKRYDSAHEKYKETKKEYKEQKKDGSETNNNPVTKGDVKRAKTDLKIAKNNLSKNYKQLKRDYVADQGKELYRSGKTITGNSDKLYAAGLIATGTAIASEYLWKTGRAKEAKYVAAAGIGLEVVNGLLFIKNEVEAKKLRAYYAHSGHYV